MSDQSDVITTDQLQIGVYVYLDVGWMHHPFSFNNFKIKTEEQLATIRGLGLKKVRWDPARSDQEPLPKPPPNESAQAAAVAAANSDVADAISTNAAASSSTTATATATATAAESNAAASPQMQLSAATQAAVEKKRARSVQLSRQRAQMAKVQEAFSNASETVRAINQKLFSNPAETIEQSQKLVGEMVDAFLAAPEVAIQVMSEKAGGEEIYLHAINVSVLAMMIGRELALPPEVMRLLGIACLFHDVGLIEVPTKITNKMEALTKAEQEFLEHHCGYGQDIAKQVQLHELVQQALYQHHELFDGSGYPEHRKGESIGILARIIAVANHYDELCNPVNTAQAMTPHEALSQMFAQQRAKFDPKIMQVLIRCLGVYPPGTVVRLNNETIGLVITINAAKPLKPSVLIYDADVPKHEAIIIDLEQEPEISVSGAIRPAQLPRPIFEYLSPRKRVSYYFDADAGKPSTGTP